MPVEKLTIDNEQAIAECVTSFWEDQRKRGQLPTNITDWDVETVRSMARSGLQFWVYRPEGQKLVHGVCAYHVSMTVSPFGSAELWMHLPVLAVHASLDHDQRMKANTLTLLGAVPDAVKQGAIGITQAFDLRNQELRAFVEDWDAVSERPTKTIWEMQGGMQRFWLRLAPDLAGLKARSREQGVDKEPIDTKEASLSDVQAERIEP